MKEESNTRFSIDISTIIISIIMIVLPFMFFYLLNRQTGSGFGLSEASLIIMFAIFSIAFLLWMKSFMKRRPYLGIITGSLAILAFVYGLIQVYYGAYTITFALIGGIVALIYMLIFFFKHRKYILIDKSEGLEKEI